MSILVMHKECKGQKYLLHAIEALIGDHEEIRAKIFNKKTMSKILLKFYDEDIVEEEYILFMA